MTTGSTRLDDLDLPAADASAAGRSDVEPRPDRPDRLERARAALAEAERVAREDPPGGAASPSDPAAGSPPAAEDRADGEGEAADRARRRSGRGSRRGRAEPTSRRPRPAAEDPAGAAGDPDGDPYQVARQIVLRQLAMAPRSRAQLEEKLAARDCPPDVAAAVLDRFTEVGLVDDEAFAGMLVRTQQEGRGLARRALAHELRRKGVDPDIAQEALAQVEPAVERATARALVDKKLRTMGGLGVQVQTRRLAGMLARKGYSGDVAYAVIRDALADSEEYRRD